MTTTKESKFNRNIKDTVKSDELKATDKQVENTVGRYDKTYVGFHELDEGLNKFLIMPSHEFVKQMLGEDVKSEPFIVPKQKWWLPIEVEDKDDKGNVKKDKKGDAIKVIKNKGIFDARIHSEVKRDIVDIYINMLKKKFEDEYGADNKEAIAKAMLPVYGQYSKNPAQRVQSIIGKPAWAMYAEKVVGNAKSLAQLEVGKAVKIRINELIAIEEANQPIGSESNNPLTQVDDRRALIVKYNSHAEDAKLYYITELDNSYDQKTKKVNFYPISDEELEAFLKLPSLSAMYKNCYTKRDFDLAMQGLEIFDERNEFGIFASNDFLDEAEALRKLYPEPKEEVVVDADAGAAEEEEDGADKFETMNRDELKKFARENKTGLAIHSRLSDDEIRNSLREWEKSHSSEETSSSTSASNNGEKKHDVEEHVSETSVAANDGKKSDKQPEVKKETAQERVARIRSGK